MAAQAIRARRVVMALALGAAALVVALVSATPALAVVETPVWTAISRTEPTHIGPAAGRNAVQALTVDATGGRYMITAQVPACGDQVRTSPAIAYNATAQELQSTLNEMGCPFGGNPVVVTGGRGGPGGGTPYEIEFTGSRNGGEPIQTLTTQTAELTGGAKAATVTNKITGVKEGILYVSATDTGGTTDGSTITIEDKLPKSLTATKVRGVDAYLNQYTHEGEGEGGEHVEMKCSPNPETEAPLRCTLEHTEIITGDTLIMAIHVKAANSESSETNEVSVSGGGALPDSISTPVEVSDKPIPYGPAPGSVIAALSSNQAGAHASLTTAFTINTNEFGHVAAPEKDLRFDLPPGLVGNATLLPKCPIDEVISQFEHFGEGHNPCPASSMVGMVTLYINLIKGDAPYGFTTPLYAIPPAPGEPVAFAFDAFVLPVRLDTSVLSNGNYGVRVTAPDLSESAETFSTYITIWGVPAERNGTSTNPEEQPRSLYGYGFGGPNPAEQPVPFLTNPQECGNPLTAIMSTDSWLKPGQFAAESTAIPPLVGCEALTMQPSFSMVADTLEAGAPAGYTLKLIVPQNSEPNALATPTVKTLKLAMPVGTVVSPGVAWGLKTCSAQEFGIEEDGKSNGEPADCPRESQIGLMEIESPNIPEKLEGAVYLASPRCTGYGGYCTPQDAQDGKMIRLYVQAISAGESKIIVKLDGVGSINQQTGQITATFEDNPPLPFNRLQLKLGGGPRAALANPRECGPATTTMDLTPWSTPFTEDSDPFYSFDITENCFGPQFHPSLVAGTTSIQSGEYSPFTLAFGRGDNDGYLAGLQQQLPPGLLGRIAGTTLCQEPQASQGECPDNSLIGHVQALSGPGADPFLVTGGKVYLTGPYKGAPFGLSIVVPAVAGPYTLSGTTGKGTVVQRAAINVDKSDAHLTITADPLPTALDGIPLQIKVIDVTIDRPEFTFNPTSCERMAIKTTLTSLEGASVDVSTPFQVTNCVGLGFNPRFEVSTAGHTSRANGASLDAKLVYPLGRKLANVKNVRVELPKQLPSRLTTLQQACPDHVFAEDPEKCPAASRVGQARAATPILPAELFGWAYFVSHGGEAFPNLILVLQDRQDGVRVDLVGDTFISKAGITSTTFGTVPDVPISEFEIYLPQGPDSALAANGNLCKSSLVMPTVFNGQNGGRLKQSTPISVTGCNASGARHATRVHAAAKQKRHKRKHRKRKHRTRKRKKARRAHGGARRGK